MALLPFHDGVSLPHKAVYSSVVQLQFCTIYIKNTCLYQPKIWLSITCAQELMFCFWNRNKYIKLCLPKLLYTESYGTPL